MPKNRRIAAAISLAFAVAMNASALEKLNATTHAALSQAVEFDVFLPLENSAQLDQMIIGQHTPGSPTYHHWLTPEQFRSQFGPNAATLAKVTGALQRSGLTVLSTHSHGVHVTGQVDAIQNTFGVTLWNAVSAKSDAAIRQSAMAAVGGSNLIATEPLRLPSALAEAGATVAHFSPVIRHSVHSKLAQAVPDNRYSPVGGYWFDDLKQAYAFPSYLNLTGRGVTIGVVMSSDYSPSDMTMYFAHEKLPVPKIVRHPVFGGAPFNPNNAASFEVNLDIQQSGGMAPGATIAVYNIPDLSDASVLAGYLTVVESNSADIVTSSFGGFEAQYLPAYNNGIDQTGILRVYEDLFRQGNAQGISFLASSGDSGALALPPPAYLNDPPKTPPVVVGSFGFGVETPAASPSVTAVGGTNLLTTYNPPTLDSKYITENAYGDPEIPYDPYGVGNLVSGGLWGSGGGKSVIFKKPFYQYFADTDSNTRTVPDISLHMGGCPGGILLGTCPSDRSFDILAFGGHFYGVIGTSASSPDFAGLLALKEQYVGHRLGNENFEIYLLALGQDAGILPFNVYHRNIPGYNGYRSHAGYNYVVGNGTVEGRNFILAPQIPAAGTPQTASNP